VKQLTYLVISILLSIGFAGQLLADVVTSVSVTDNVANSFPSQTVAAPLAASASVSSRTNIASGSSSLNVTASSINNFSFSDAASPSVISQSATSFDNFFLVTGGNGSGYLALTYANSVSGFSDAQASANASLVVMQNGATLYNARVCMNMIGQVSSFSCNNQINVGFAITYGQPFELSAMLSAVAGGGLGGSNIGGTGAFSYALFSSAGGPPALGTLTLTPEPTSSMLLALGGLLLMIAVLGRKRFADD
jgi:hypothetical protein